MVSLKVSDVTCKNQNCSAKLCSNKKVSFGAAPVAIAKTAEKAAKTAEKSLDDLNIFTRFNKWYVTKNEINTILITALGTGIIAPLVLAINPIAKEDKKTKQYTALRQPLSAGLAIITQVGINAPIPKLIDRQLVLKAKLPYYYLPNPKNIGKKTELDTKHYKESDKPIIMKRYEEALSDSKFKENLSDFIYKNQLKDAKINTVKDIGYLKRFFSPKVKAEIKKQIAEKTKTIKQLTPDQITLEQAIDYASGNLKTLKSLVGITASVIVLFPTFTFLNWIYPRFVEKFFPQLVKDKPMAPAKPQDIFIVADNDKRKAGI